MLWVAKDVPEPPGKRSAWRTPVPTRQGGICEGIPGVCKASPWAEPAPHTRPDGGCGGTAAGLEPAPSPLPVLHSDPRVPCQAKSRQCNQSCAHHALSIGTSCPGLSLLRGQGAGRVTPPFSPCTFNPSEICQFHFEMCSKSEHLPLPHCSHP